MGPLGPIVGSLDTYMLHPSLGFFLLFFVAGFEARAPTDGERKLLHGSRQSLMACHAFCCDEVCHGCEITGGGRQCWILDFNPLKALRIKATQVRNGDLHPEFNTSLEC
jgi:hypothetical protein